MARAGCRGRAPVPPTFASLVTAWHSALSRPGGRSYINRPRRSTPCNKDGKVGAPSSLPRRRERRHPCPIHRRTDPNGRPQSARPSRPRPRCLRSRRRGSGDLRAGLDGRQGAVVAADVEGQSEGGGQEWKKEAKRVIKAELARSDVTYQGLAAQLAEIGVKETTKYRRRAKDDGGNTRETVARRVW
ncbi:DUF6471 domain-containing protein [Endothiovibrio diazotrophicus]